MKMKYSGLLGLLLLIVGIVISLTTGSMAVSLSDLLHVVTGTADHATNLIVFDFRLPRLLIALFAGCGLALSGYLFQTITHNELADPGILGINAGAGLFVLFYLGFFANNQMSWLLPLVACVGGLFAALLVYFCGRQAERIVPNRLLLAGVAVNAGISALTLIGTIRVSKDSYQFVTAWLSGTIWGTTWQHVGLVLPWLVVIIPLLLAHGRTLEILNLGDEAALGLGVRLKKTQLWFLIAAVCLAAVSVAVAGSISFIGLIAPHMARSLTGKKNNYSFLLTGLLGAVLLLYGDILGRVLLPTGEIAAGIVVAIIGAPYFIYQLVKS
ncbi:FecCD family ABC transporter permease [Enterococcus sp. CSURQ0835]|uniref:FecCD family ABC transporter permease n=1 Tax=Enterococcus sp. CSURQ0835 TaxID=2681394 RepID=UPI00135AFC69|nr:iron ABC transporter permease [Enterococcus sp. CSURQ0835]